MKVLRDGKRNDFNKQFVVYGTKQAIDILEKSREISIIDEIEKKELRNKGYVKTFTGTPVHELPMLTELQMRELNIDNDRLYTVNKEVWNEIEKKIYSYCGVKKSLFKED